jgi:hypothetical protein
MKRVWLLVLFAGCFGTASRAQTNDPLTPFYNNTLICAGSKGTDVCHIWFRADGTFMIFGGGMQGGHFGHFKPEPARADGEIPICYDLDTLGPDIPASFRARGQSPAAAKAVIARFHQGVCHALRVDVSVGSDWVEKNDPFPVPGAPDRFVLLPGHR